MTHLNLHTRFEAGCGTIEMRPGHYEEEIRDLIHGLPLHGISSVNERTTVRDEETTELCFDHTQPDRLEGYAQIIVAAMIERGCEVTFDEPASAAPQPSRSRHFVGRLLHHIAA